MRRKSTAAVAACVAIMILAAACEKRGTEGDKAYAVSGIVTDSISGSPISGATIRWPDTTSAIPDPRLTDSSGRYAFPLYSGSTTVFVQKEGYRTKWRQLTNVRGNVTNCDFQLAPE